MKPAPWQRDLYWLHSQLNDHSQWYAIRIHAVILIVIKLQSRSFEFSYWVKLWEKNQSTNERVRERERVREQKMPHRFCDCVKLSHSVSAKSSMNLDGNQRHWKRVMFSFTHPLLGTLAMRDRCYTNMTQSIAWKAKFFFASSCSHCTRARVYSFFCTAPHYIVAYYTSCCSNVWRFVYTHRWGSAIKSRNAFIASYICTCWPRLRTSFKSYSMCDINLLLLLLLLFNWNAD